MTFKTFASTLENKLKLPLSGHEKFLEKDANLVREITPNFKKARKSAVLLAFYPEGDEIYLPLILRPPYDGTHGGQMALPGGRMEPFDESLTRTALREAEEEIGIKALDVKIIGELTDVYIAPSNYWVKPVVGLLDYKPTFFPDEREVASVHSVSLTELKNHDNRTERKVNVRNRVINTRGFELQEQWVWGATALMLSEFLEIWEG